MTYLTFDEAIYITSMTQLENGAKKTDLYKAIMDYHSNYNGRIGGIQIEINIDEFGEKILNYSEEEVSEIINKVNFFHNKVVPFLNGENPKSTSFHSAIPHSFPYGFLDSRYYTFAFPQAGLTPPVDWSEKLKMLEFIKDLPEKLKTDLSRLNANQIRFVSLCEHWQNDLGTPQWSSV